MPIFAKLKGMITFIKVIRPDSSDDRPAKPLIRHQNPRLNDNGVIPAWPLPPAHPMLRLINKDTELREEHGEGRRPVKYTRFGFRPAIKGADVGVSPVSPRAVSSPAKQRIKPKCNGTKPPLNKNATKADVKAPVNPVAAIDLTTNKSNEALQSPARADSTQAIRQRIPRLPRIPHQQMHFIRRIGSGGEGHCSLFRLHHRPRTLLAVKTLISPPELVWSQTKKRVPIEAHILQGLLPPNPHVIKLYDYTHSPLGTKFYYEYCPLGDLQDTIDKVAGKGRRVPESFIWHAFAQLADAVHFLHTGSPKGVQILHRDIKPANILLRPSTSPSQHNNDGNAKPPYPDLILADFGCATHVTPKPSPRSCVGTLSYMGPELPLQNTAGDIWALGAVIHALAL
ncbi:MAG: hypothetical protein Q9170_008360, partial [Blastenia crenularia]